MLGTAPGVLVGVVKRAVLDQVRIEARSALRLCLRVQSLSLGFT